MMREVFFTDNAKVDLETICYYLDYHSSNQKKVDFLVALSEQIALIEAMPFMYQATEKRADVRRCIVLPNVAVFYKLEVSSIAILAIKDTRIDPENIYF